MGRGRALRGLRCGPSQANGAGLALGTYADADAGWELGGSRLFAGPQRRCRLFRRIGRQALCGGNRIWMQLQEEDRMASLIIDVNGNSYTVDVEPDMPLLWVLRDVIGLTGTKYSCGIGMCGTCTVHVDGEAVQSCSLPVSEAAGKRITTIEGLSP